MAIRVEKLSLMWFLWHICLAYVLHMCCIYLAYILHISCICLAYVLYIFCYVLHMSCLCLACVLHMPCICLYVILHVTSPLMLREWLCSLHPKHWLNSIVKEQDAFHTNCLT
jgi:hypothetical protein